MLEHAVARFRLFGDCKLIQDGCGCCAPELQWLLRLLKTSDCSPAIHASERDVMRGGLMLIVSTEFEIVLPTLVVDDDDLNAMGWEVD